MPAIYGALVPSRQVASAKSWLAYGGVDRTAPILPFGHEPGERAVSPVEASARYLAHMRDAWNATHARGDAALRFEAQRIVLTVPASFDEEARELTIAAAAQAGLVHLTVIEEPLAALYAWIASNRRALDTYLSDGEHILVCDVGGGTTDFSLIRVGLEGEELAFERVAIGEHLLLGGDNLDLALAALVEERLGSRLSLTQRLAFADSAPRPRSGCSPTRRWTAWCSPSLAAVVRWWAARNRPRSPGRTSCACSRTGSCRSRRTTSTRAAIAALARCASSGCHMKQTPR